VQVSASALLSVVRDSINDISVSGAEFRCVAREDGKDDVERTWNASDELLELLNVASGVCSHVENSHVVVTRE